MSVKKINRVVMTDSVLNDLDSKATRTELQNVKTELENQIASVISNLIVKPSVATFGDIATTYPNPQEGWQVTVDDTNITYTYDEDEGVWNKTSINAIPKATPSLDGLMTKEDKSKIDTIEEGAEVNKSAEIVFEETKSLAGHGSGFDADTLDQKHASDFALSGHDHDGRYYTKTQMDTALSGKSDSGHRHSNASSSVDGFMSKEDKVKLDAVEDGANRYVHPSTHSLDEITETATKKIMTASERSKLAGIEENANNYVHPATHSLDEITETTTKKIMTSDERSKLSGIESGANKYTHPSTHSIDMITDSTSYVRMTPSERTKLSGVEDNANNYVHPSSHPASMIVQDSTRRFVTDAEKNTWNAKATKDTVTQSADGLMSSEDKTKLDGIDENANNYSHPSGDGNLHVPATGSTNSNKVLKAGSTAGSISWGSVAWGEVTGKPTTFTPASHNHPASEVVETATQRFVSDNEKAVWNAKADASSVYTKSEVYTKDETDDRIESVIGSAPVALDTLKELADALGNDANFSATVTNQLATKVDKVSGKGLSTNDYTTAEKTKLAGISSGAEVNQNAFSNIKVGTTTISADTKQDTVEIVAGSNVTITPDATNDKVTIAVDLSNYVTQGDLGNAGYGDMTKSVYDTDGDGKVDSAETADSVPWSGVTGKPSTFTPSTHTHDVLSVKPNNYKDATALPSTYDRGQTVFHSSNPTNKFNGVQYCTVHTIKGYHIPAVQFIYPYNVDAPIYYRYGLYNSDTWLDWRALATNDVATTSTNGLMSSADKSKLDSIASGAEVNQNAFSHIAVSGQSTVSADSKTDTLTLVNGTNISITTNATDDSVTISVTGLATVATSGSYNDLTDKPVLAPVATSGNYNDLSNKPTVPSKTSDLTNDSLFMVGAVGTTAPSSPATNMIWIDTN